MKKHSLYDTHNPSDMDYYSCCYPGVKCARKPKPKKDKAAKDITKRSPAWSVVSFFIFLVFIGIGRLDNQYDDTVLLYAIIVDVVIFLFPVARFLTMCFAFIIFSLITSSAFSQVLISKGEYEELKNDKRFNHTEETPAIPERPADASDFSINFGGGLSGEIIGGGVAYQKQFYDGLYIVSEFAAHQNLGPEKMKKFPNLRHTFLSVAAGPRIEIPFANGFTPFIQLCVGFAYQKSMGLALAYHTESGFGYTDSAFFIFSFWPTINVASISFEVKGQTIINFLGL